MKCSKCKGSNIGWHGELFEGEGGWIALVSAVCPNCNRTYQARIDWEAFGLKKIGGVVDGKTPKEPEELIPAGEAKELVNKLAQQTEWPGMQDPRGR